MGALQQACAAIQPPPTATTTSNRSPGAIGSLACRLLGTISPLRSTAILRPVMPSESTNWATVPIPQRVCFSPLMVTSIMPAIVALVGITLYRAIRPLLGAHEKLPGGAIEPGFQPETIHGARIFVLPNPSGRNANFSYDEMLAAFTTLRRAVSALERP